MSCTFFPRRSLMTKWSLLLKFLWTNVPIHTELLYSSKPLMQSVNGLCLLDSAKQMGKD